jgi:hypothetical protein
MLHKKVNKDSSTKKTTSSREVSTSRSHSKRDDHGNDKKSRRMTKNHNCPRKSTRRTSASLGIGSIQSVSLVQRQRRRPHGDIFQGKLRNIKPLTFKVSTRREKRPRTGYWK